MNLADPARESRIPTVVVAVLTSLVLVAGLATAAAGAAATGPATTDAATVRKAGQKASQKSEVAHLDPAWYERRVVAEINERRAAHHRSRLRINRCADRLAERWSRYLAAHFEFYHQDLGPFSDRCGASYAGETLARGAVRPTRIVRLWMHSPGHRRILLSRNPRRLGIGAHTDRYGNWVVAADFIRS